MRGIYKETELGQVAIKDIEIPVKSRVNVLAIMHGLQAVHVGAIV